MIPITQVASVPVGSLNPVFPPGGNLNGGGSVGFESWGESVLQTTICFPYSGEYEFKIGACFIVDVRPHLGNDIGIYVDQVALEAVGSTPGNDFVHFICNANAATTQPYSFKGFVTAGNHSVTIQFNFAQAPGNPTPQVYADVLTISTTGKEFPIEPPGSRDPSLYPMSSNSLWNQAITDMARWSNPTDADTVQLTGATGAMNSSQWSVPVYIGQSTDPASTWQDYGGQLICPDVSIPGPVRNLAHAPANMSVAPPVPGDGNIAVIDGGNKRYAYVGFAGSVSKQAVTVGRGKWIDNYNVNPGMDQGEGDYLGLIRAQDIADGVIAHQLIVGLSPNIVKAGTSNISGLAWPACESDYNGPFGLYTGQILYGSKIGIPAVTPMPSNLTADGKVLWTALVNYGAVNNVTGGTNQVTLYAEQALSGSPHISNMTNDFKTIMMPYLRIMRNHTSQTPNGGGNPLVPMRAGLMKNLPQTLP